MPPITTVGGGRRRALPWLASSSRLVALALFSVGLAGSVVASAWNKHGHFYAAGIALARSGTSMLALLNLLLLSALVTARGIQAVVFGPLRGIEVEHLYERSWIAVTELLLAMTTFRDDFDARFALYFTLLLFLKAFHWITADRVDIMEQLPSAPFLSHFRLQLFMASMLTLDIFLCRLATASFADSGPSVMLLFGFEYTILASSMLVTAIKYFINLYDARQDNAWEAKSTWVFYLDLVHDLFKLVNYMAFFVVIITHYGLPLHALRDLYLTLRSFLLKVRDLLRYRRATRNMNTRYPDATALELSQVSDRTCIICREDMYAAGEPLPPATGAGAASPASNSPPQRIEEEPVPIPSPQEQARPGTPSVPMPPATGATAAPTRSQIPKKLPCGHIFHFGCMRSWLERQQSCPTCRRPLLDTTAAATPPAAAAAPAAQRNNNNPAPPAPPVGAGNAHAPDAPAPAPAQQPPQRPRGFFGGFMRPTAPAAAAAPAGAPTPDPAPPAPPAPATSTMAASAPPPQPAPLPSVAELVAQIPLPPPPPPPPMLFSPTLAHPAAAYLPPLGSAAAADPLAPLSDQELAAFAAAATDRAALETQVRVLGEVQAQLAAASLRLVQILSIQGQVQQGQGRGSGQGTEGLDE